MRRTPLRAFFELNVPGHARRLVVPPIGMSSLDKLSRPLADYFPGCAMDEWFAHAEPWRKVRVREALGDRCAVCGAGPATVHEIQAQGMGEFDGALVLWNMIPVCWKHHVEMQKGLLVVLFYDPLIVPVRGENRLPLVVMRRNTGKAVACAMNLPEMERERLRTAMAV